MTNEEYEAERESMLFDRERFPCGRTATCTCPRCRPDLTIAVLGDLAAQSGRPLREHRIGCTKCGIVDCGIGQDEAKRRYQDHLLKIMDAVDRGEALSRLKENADEEKA